MTTTPPAHSDAVRGLLAALAVVVFWSGFNIVSRFGATASFTPFDIAALRYGVSGTIALPEDLIGHYGHQRLHGGVISAALD